MTDALSESSRRQRAERLHEEFLDAVLEYFRIPFPDNLDEVAQAVGRMATHEPEADLQKRAVGLYTMLGLLRQHHEPTWADFIWCIVGLRDTRRLHKFREHSPFKDCSFVAYDTDSGGRDVRISGQEAEFFAAMRENVWVETRKFVVARTRDRMITLLVLHPEALR